MSRNSTPQHRNGGNREYVGKVTAAEKADADLRKRCLSGTEAYRLALIAAGYQISNEDRGGEAA